MIERRNDIESVGYRIVRGPIRGIFPAISESLELQRARRGSHLSITTVIAYRVDQITDILDPNLIWEVVEQDTFIENNDWRINGKVV